MTESDEKLYTMCKICNRPFLPRPRQIYCSAECRRKAEKNKYDEIAKEKRCTRCGAQDARTISGKTLCGKCWDKKSADKLQRYYDRKTEGLCPRCGKPNDSAYIHCDSCRKASWEGRKRLYSYRRENKLCQRCGAPIKVGIFCMKCYDLNNRDRRKYYAETGK